MPKKQDFKALKDKWYAKLEKSGFNDIEQDENNLNRWDSFHFKMQHSPLEFNSIEEYYRIANQMVHDYKFKSKLEKTIWTFHASGMEVTAIIKKLKSMNFKGKRVSTYYTIIKEIASQMREYANKE